MGNMGKIWGGGLGFLLGGPVGAAIGLGIGHLYDEDNIDGIQVVCPHCKTELIIPEEGYYQCYNCHKNFTYGDVQISDEEFLFRLIPVFNLIIKLFKVDGHINGDEKLALDDLFRNELEFSGDILKEARKIFNKLIKDKTHYTVSANEVLTIKSDHEFKSGILLLLIQFAIADGFLNEKEYNMIKDIAFIFGYSEKEYLEICFEVLNYDGNHFLISFIVKMCKVDGLINREEIDFVDEYLRSEFSGKSLKDARKMCNLFKKDSTSYTKIAEFISSCTENVELKMDIIYLMFKIAIADAPLNKKEENMIENIAYLFGLSDIEYSQIKDDFCIDIRKCYTILECNETDSLDTIKQNYRQLIRQYHPDKITSKDMAKDIVDFAQTRFRDIQEAYDIILKKRQEE